MIRLGLSILALLTASSATAGSKQAVMLNRVTVVNAALITLQEHTAPPSASQSLWIDDQAFSSSAPAVVTVHQFSDSHKLIHLDF